MHRVGGVDVGARSGWCSGWPRVASVVLHGSPFDEVGAASVLSGQPEITQGKESQSEHGEMDTVCGRPDVLCYACDGTINDSNGV